MINKIVLITIYVFIACSVIACEKKEPVYVLKPEVGENTMVHFELMKDQPKYLRIKKSEWERTRTIEERKKLRDKLRNVYRKENLWDY